MDVDDATMEDQREAESAESAPAKRSVPTPPVGGPNQGAESRQASNEVTKAEEALRKVEDDYITALRRQAVQARQTRNQLLKRIAFWVVVLGIGFLGWRILEQRQPAVLSTHGWYLALAGFLGALLGGSELVSRYRDEPTRALTSTPGVFYMLLNAIISMSAYGLLTRYGAGLIPSLTDDPLMRSIVGGFGAMAILRSKFLTLRTENGEDVGVGPDAAISAFLSAADRGVDRTRAAKRLKLVFRRVSRVTDYCNVSDFIRVSLSAFQNLNEKERSAIDEKIKKIYTVGNAEYPTDELKLQALCYEVLVIAGEYNFNSLIDNLMEFIEQEEEKRRLRENREKALQSHLDKVTKAVEEVQAAKSP